MSISLAWRAAVATVLGIVLGVFALAFINGADGGSAPADQNQSHFAPRLSLIRQATTGELISLQIAPFEVGSNTLRVSLLNPLGKPQHTNLTRLRVSRMDALEDRGEVGTTQSGSSRETTFLMPGPGWWQIDVIVNSGPTVTFYVRLDQPSHAPTAFAPPDYSPDEDARQLFVAALSRYKGLAGLKWREELTSGDPGPSGFGVWFLTNLDASRQGLHAATINMDPGSSELYSGETRQCFRQGRDDWQCTDGAAPVGPFDLSYLDSATGFKKGGTEAIDGEITQVLFFYNPFQSAWYVWWIGEQTHYVRRQAMIANGHFMLDRFSDHNLPVSIQPRALPAQ